MSYNDNYDDTSSYGGIDSTQVMNTGDYAQSYENSGYSYNDNYKPKEPGVTGRAKQTGGQTFYNYSDGGRRKRSQRISGGNNRRLIPMGIFFALIFFSFLTLRSYNGNPTVSTPTVTQTVTQIPSPSTTTPDINKDEVKERGQELGSEARDGLDKAKDLGDSFVKGFKSGN